MFQPGTVIGLKLPSPISFDVKLLTDPSNSASYDLQGDFTVFVEAELFYQALITASDSDPADVRSRHAFDFDQPIALPVSKKKAHVFKGRVHAVRCCKNSAFSVTLRSLKGAPISPPPAPRPLPEYDIKEEIGTAFDVTESTWSLPLVSLTGNEDCIVAEPLSEPGPLAYLRKVETPGLAKFCEDRKFLSPTLHSDQTALGQLFPDPSDAAGLLLISGETGCGKTTFLNGLLLQYWRKHIQSPKPRRRPHMVVIGDPVETSFYSRPGPFNPGRNDSSAHCQMVLGDHRLFDLTERVLGVDTPSVEEALRDALRETPSVVVVSELRREEDFLAALDFAGTGHLVLSTSHNTSLVDTMSKLMRVSRARTPGDRAMLAQRLHGLVHLIPHRQEFQFSPGERKGKPFHGGKLPLQANVPLVWRANAAGVRNFVSEGLSSLYPRSPRENFDKVPVLGRAWFVERLKNLHLESNNKTSAWAPLIEKPKDGELVDPFEAFKKSMLALDLHSY